MLARLSCLCNYLFRKIHQSDWHLPASYALGIVAHCRSPSRSQALRTVSSPLPSLPCALGTQLYACLRHSDRAACPCVVPECQPTLPCLSLVPHLLAATYASVRMPSLNLSTIRPSDTSL